MRSECHQSGCGFSACAVTMGPLEKALLPFRAPSSLGREVAMEGRGSMVRLPGPAPPAEVSVLAHRFAGLGAWRNVLGSPPAGARPARGSPWHPSPFWLGPPLPQAGWPWPWP